MHMDYFSTFKKKGGHILKRELKKKEMTDTLSYKEQFILVGVEMWEEQITSG